jgi:hypothetical protein
MALLPQRRSPDRGSAGPDAGNTVPRRDEQRGAGVSSDGSTTNGAATGGAADEGSAARRRGRTAAEQRQEKVAQSNDPEALAAEIEKTREELAETLDAIADKVSPKRVATRTKKKVGDAVKDGASGAAASVKSGANQLKDAVHDKTAGVGTSDAGDASGEGLADALESVGQEPGVVAGPTTAVDAPGLRPVPAPAPGAGVPVRLGPPALAGAAAALVVALFLMRRRRRTRSRWR